MIFIISISVFSSVIMVLVLYLLFLEARIVKQGSCEIIINENQDKDISVPLGVTLLSALGVNDIFLPSACGGGGSCGQCKCKVESGGGDLMPTELPHLSRIERRENIRLACQMKVRENLKIRIPDEIFSIKKYNATVVSNENVSTFIKELNLKLAHSEVLKFNAGAYIQIDIPEYSEILFKDFDIAQRFVESWNRFNLFKISSRSDEAVFRAYSLANPPHEKDCLKFTIRIATPPLADIDTIPSGIGSTYIFNLKKGDNVTLSGPYGDFFVKDTDREICFIGGGAGMAPMRCHILHQLISENTTRKITFWYGARSKKELFYHNEFSELEKKYDNFSFFVALSEPEAEDNWAGMKGFIHQCLYDNYLKNHQDPSEIEYYLCGPGPMLDAVNKILYDLGVEPDMIAYDVF